MPADGWRPLQQTRSRPGATVRLPDDPFPRLANAHLLSAAGDALVTLALAGSLFFSISPNDARGRVALSLVLTMAPFAVVAPLLGPIIDRSRWGRRAMVVAAGGGRAITCLLMARHLDSLLLFPSAFAALVLSKGYSVAKSSLVPSAVTRAHDLVEANARLAIVGVVGGFVASIPGVALLRFVGATWVLRLASVVFVVGALAALRIVEHRDPIGDPLPEETSGDRVALPVAEHERPPLSVVAAAVAMALLRAVVGFLTFLVAFGFRRLGGPSWWFGVVLAVSMAAGLAGAAAAPLLRGRLREETIIAGALALVAATGLALSRQADWGFAAVMAGAVGLAAAAAKLAFDALVQRDAPEEIRGRSFARFETGFQLVWVVGALLPVLLRTPLDLGYASMGIGCGLAAMSYVAAERRLRPAEVAP